MAKKPLRRITAISGTVGLIAAGMFYYLLDAAKAEAPGFRELLPYFSYSAEELKSLDTLNSDKIITEAEINHWVEVVFNLVRKNHTEIDATRIYTYLFTAQQDAAALSYKSKKKLAGNLTAVSTKTLCLLLPDECALIPPAEEPDAYSIKVAELVANKVNERLQAEKQALDSAPIPTPPKGWRQDVYYYASNFGNMKTWLLNTGNQFRPQNPKEYDPEQIKLQKEALERILSSITEEQIRSANKWSLGPKSISLSGVWIKRANEYMIEHNISLERALIIRSVLAMGIADATIAYIDTKYTYWKQRPTSLFPDIKGHIKSAESPSYPSGHATTAMAAAIIMDHYFPENQTQWEKTANEMGQSRLWGGVHFPIDEQDGIELGRKIGEWIVEKIKNKKN